MPSPVGPLGPDKFEGNDLDPNDLDLWDWDDVDESPVRKPSWLVAIAWVLAAVFVLFVVFNVVR